jgi:hypothetical protein
MNQPSEMVGEAQHDTAKVWEDSIEPCRINRILGFVIEHLGLESSWNHGLPQSINPNRRFGHWAYCTSDYMR